MYYDTSRKDVLVAQNPMVEFIKENNLEYPVTVINGQPMYEGGISYPAILRAVQTRLNELC
jgi:disulfide oxidoreductase YuzD